MLARKENLQEGFKRIYTESWKHCRKELEGILQLSRIFLHFNKTMSELRREKKEMYENSLVDYCFCEAVRLNGHILFLASNALYKNAYDNIRYMLESIVQTTYLDMEHPDSTLATKIEIWKEIEGKRDYHAQKLIGKLDLGEMKEQKTILEKEYSRLSNIIHFGHKQVVATIRDVHSKVGDGIPAKMDCTEIRNILNSMKTAFDIFFLLVMVRFAGIEVKLKTNPTFMQAVREHKLPILCRIFSLKC